MKIASIVNDIELLQLDDTLQTALERLSQAQSSFIPVIDAERKLQGVVTLAALAARELEELGQLEVKNCLEHDVTLVEQGKSFDEIPVRCGSLVVINARQQVVGIITAQQFAKSLLDCVFSKEHMLREGRRQDTGPVKIKDMMTEAAVIINSSYDGMFVTDGNGVVLIANDAYERITGVKVKDIQGKNMVELVDEGFYDQSVTLLVLQRRESITINQRVKPTNKHIMVTGNPVFNENGDVVRVVTNVRDVTALTNLYNRLSKFEEEKMQYETELSHLRSLQLRSGDIIFRSKAMADVVELAVKVAEVNSNVLITGESGTGKELVAKLIHQSGKGEKKPFIKINCGAIPEALLESELFGHERGAFTGARKEGKPGLFELAHEGTLFLDEIGEMPTFLQVKLLRAIQEKTITRLGGVTPLRVDVRIIAATHRDLAKMVEMGTFREDLYYRLMVIPLRIPALRERKDDIPLLIRYFLEKFNQNFSFKKTVSARVVDALTAYRWPGNVRELENVMERMMVIARDEVLDVSDLPQTMVRQVGTAAKRGTTLKGAVAQVEKAMLLEAFHQHGSWQKAAEVLGVDRTTAFRKAIKYGLIAKEEGE